MGPTGCRRTVRTGTITWTMTSPTYSRRPAGDRRYAKFAHISFDAGAWEMCDANLDRHVPAEGPRATRKITPGHWRGNANQCAGIITTLPFVGPAGAAG